MLHLKEKSIPVSLDVLHIPPRLLVTLISSGHVFNTSFRIAKAEFCFCVQLRDHRKPQNSLMFGV